MSKFGRKNKGGSPAISTASLPDIVFMLLFFFMVTTTMRTADLKVDNKIPYSTELKKLEKKSLVSYIYVGEPKKQYRALFGTEPRIQLNDQFAKVSDIEQFITSEREAREEAEVPQMTTSIKADAKVKMGIITDIKQALREVNALKINYSTKKQIRK